MKRPEPTSRHPLIVFLMFLCVLTGLRVLLGAGAPNSIQAELSGWQITLWGLGCGGGAVFFLIGIHLQPHDGAKHVKTGIVLEQFGAAVLCGACLLYAACLAEAVRLDGIFLVGIVTVFGIACGMRFWTIQKHINSVNDEANQLREAAADGPR